MSERVVVFLQERKKPNSRELKYKHMPLGFLSKEGQIEAIKHALEVARDSQNYPNMIFYGYTYGRFYPLFDEKLAYAVTMRNSSMDKSVNKASVWSDPDFF